MHTAEGVGDGGHGVGDGPHLLRQERELLLGVRGGRGGLRSGESSLSKLRAGDLERRDFEHPKRNTFEGGTHGHMADAFFAAVLH